MATVPYQSFHDEDDIGVNDDSISNSGSEHSHDAATYPAGPSNSQPTSSSVHPDVNADSGSVGVIYPQTNWPYRVGAMLLGHGSLLLLLGVAQVIILPLVLDIKDDYPVLLASYNCYGVALWCGFLIGISGATGLNAAIHRSLRSLYVFTLLVLFNILAVSGCILLILIGYTSLWTVPSAYGDGGVGFGVHVAVSCMVCFGFILIMHAFTHYYEQVLCGDIQLCRKIVHCCCPCWCPRVVYQNELMDEDASSRPPGERPPSLPV